MRLKDRSPYAAIALRFRALRIRSIIKNSRFLRRGKRPGMLDKAGAAMVISPNLGPPKENEAKRDSNSIVFYRLRTCGRDYCSGSRRNAKPSGAP
jgi:hypothetical protein